MIRAAVHPFSRIQRSVFCDSQIQSVQSKSSLFLNLKKSSSAKVCECETAIFKSALMSNHGERHPVTTNHHSNVSVTLVSSHAQNEHNHDTQLVSLHVSQPHHSHHLSQVQQQTQSIASMPSGGSLQTSPAANNSVTAAAVAARTVATAAIVAAVATEEFALNNLEHGFTDLNLSSDYPTAVKVENNYSPYVAENDINSDPLCGANNLDSSYNFSNTIPNLIQHSDGSTLHIVHSSNNGSGNNAQVTSPIYNIENKDKQFHSDVPFPHFSSPSNAENLLYQSYLYNSRSLEDEESFDSDDTFSDESSIRHKPMLSDVMLQTVPENFIHSDMNALKNSKKICFDSLERDSRSQNGMTFSPNGQNPQYPNLTLVQQAANLAIASPTGLLNQFDSSPQNPLNVANSYGYSYRRWSNRDAPTVKNTKAGSIQLPHTIPNMFESDRDFQYLLGAPTAAGTKHGEMTMTYLNQGQSYEIRLKRIQKTPEIHNMKTTIRLGFYEKRLLYKEIEEISNWNYLNPKDRPLEIDIAMSYGVFNINPVSEYNNIIQFEWNPGREASIFIKVNCISTAFTFKRHGGERGSPFRLIIETTNNVDSRVLDKASCLIKVFKSKGAERKHKTDRDRIAKHPDADKLFRPSTDCTVFTTYQEEPMSPKTEKTESTCMNSSCSVVDGSAQSPISSVAGSQSYHRNSDTPNLAEASPTLPQCHPGKTSRPELPGPISSSLSNTDPTSTMAPAGPATPNCSQLPQSTSQSEDVNNSSVPGGTFDNSGSNCTIPFPVNASAIDTYHWLRKHRFFQLAERLCEYTADDLKRLSKNDLLDLCDRKDGLRLYNLIHLPEAATTKLKIFITFDAEEYFALYLKSWTAKEFKEKLFECLTQHDSSVRLRNMHTIIRGGRKVRVTDNDVENIKHEAIFCCKLIKVDDDEFDVQLSETENSSIDS